MRLDPAGPRQAALTSPVLAPVLSDAAPLAVPGVLLRAVRAVGQLLAGVGVLLVIPIAILVIGTPIALAVRLLLWAVGAL